MELTESEQKDLRIILDGFYGREVAHWKMNKGTLEATAQMLAGIKECSISMDYVPRPGIVDKDHFRRQLRNIARRVANQGADYKICHIPAARNWKSRIYIAGERL